MPFRLTLSVLVVLLLAAVAPSHAQQGAYTPAPGSAERKAIYDAMRKSGDNPDREFVVRRLKVLNGWAWTIVDPRSRTGRNRFETEAALLQKQAAGWKVMDQPCGEEDCDTDKEVARIRKAFPQAPAAIFQ